MNGEPLIWQQPQWQQLLSLLSHQRLPHALMFAGPPEIGKQQFAQAFAHLLLCQAPLETAACGRCKSCQLLAASTHPDFLAIEPEAQGKMIKIEQIRRLGEFAARTASMGQRRVILVAPAEAMNVNAANAFLNTVEEPGEGVVLILVVHQTGAILPTIRSRCRLLGFHLPDESLVREWLTAQGCSTADQDQVMPLAGGRPLRALRLLDTDLKDQLAQFRDALSALEHGTMAPLEAARIFQGLPAQDAMEWFQYELYARAKADIGRSDEPGRMLFRFLDRVNRARQRLLSAANPNPQLVWEEIFMDWKSMIDLRQRTGG